METRVLHFELVEQGDKYLTRLHIDGDSAIEEAFGFELREGSRITGVLQAIEEGSCNEDNLRDVGSQLWTGLTGGVIRSRVAKLFGEPGKFTQVRLKLPRGGPDTFLPLPLLPWEALYDDTNIGFLAGNPCCCIIREPELPVQLPETKPEEGSRIGLLTAVPEGAGLSVETEISNLRTVVEPLPNLEMRPLRGRVTSDRLRGELQSGGWGIFHFIGHGEAQGDQHVRLRLNQDDGSEFWIDAEAFGTLFVHSGVKLAVLNCCEGGHPATARSLSGLGRVLMIRGVPVVIAMRYPIPDDLAIRFSQAFYSELVDGRFPGRVDLALEEARNALYRNSSADNKRGFITPLLFMASGHEQLFDIRSVPGPEEPAVAVSDMTQHIQLPDHLAQAFAENRCIPVVGPDIVSRGTERRSREPSVPLTSIVEKLAHDIGYPESDRLRLADPQIGLAEHIFPSVAQFFEARRRRFELIEAVREICREARPSDAHLQLADWDAAALFYLHFDGLMEQAYIAEKHSRTVVNSIEAAADRPPQDQLLVLVRGTINVPGSLVLTEEDHDGLATAITHLPARLEDTTRAELGRSVVFLGANPTDPALRRLADKLIDPKGNQGPPFFVARSVSEVDKAWWDHLEVEWVEAEPADVIAALSAGIS